MNSPVEDGLERGSNVIKWIGIILGGAASVCAVVWGGIQVVWELQYKDQLTSMIEAETLAVLQSTEHAEKLAEHQLRNLASLELSDYENLPPSYRLKGNLIEEMLAVPDLDEFRKRVDSVYSFEMSRLYPTVFRDGKPPQANTNADDGGVATENNRVRLFLNRNDTVRLYAYQDINGPNGRILAPPPARIWLQVGASPEDRVSLDGGVENFSLNCMLEQVFKRRQDGQNKAVDVSLHFEAFGTAVVEYNYDLFFMITKEERELANCA